MFNYQILKNLRKLSGKLRNGSCSAKKELTESEQKKERLLSRLELEAMQNDSFPVSLYEIKLRRVQFHLKVICK
jgi:hypothetical protein